MSYGLKTVGGHRPSMTAASDPRHARLTFDPERLVLHLSLKTFERPPAVYIKHEVCVPMRMRSRFESPPINKRFAPWLLGKSLALTSCGSGQSQWTPEAYPDRCRASRVFTD